MVVCNFPCMLKLRSFQRFPIVSSIFPVGILSYVPARLALSATFLQQRSYSLPVRMASAKLRANATDIFKAGVTSVLPHTMVTHTLKLDGDRLLVGDHNYTLKNNVHVVAFGKAVIGMVRAAEDILGDHIVDGIASVPWSIQETMKNLGKWELLPLAKTKVRIMEGGVNNIPDDISFRAASEIFNLLDSLTADDLVLALISGGGSALLPSPIPPITLDDLKELTRMLANHGATIQQLNTIRKHIELLKGGGLAKAAYPAQVIALLISDVVGNDLDYISSGPTVPDFTTPRQCLDLLETLGVLPIAPRSVVELLQTKANLPEFTKDITEGGSESSDLEQVVQKNQPSFHCNNVQNLIIGSNEVALQAAALAATNAGYAAFILSSEIVGDANDIGEMFAQLATYICRSLRSVRGADADLVATEIALVGRGVGKKTITALSRVIEESAHTGRPVCVLAAGETTVQVRGNGVGGRCQQMALASAIAMDKLMTSVSDIEHEFAVVFLAAGTDGQDGPTDAAGSVVDPGLVSRAKRNGPGNPADSVTRNDANTFLKNFERGRNLLKTGLTGTNVMDLHLLLIEQCKTNSHTI